MVSLEKNIIAQIADVCFDYVNLHREGLHNYLSYEIIKHLRNENYTVIQEYEIYHNHSEVGFNKYGFKKMIRKGYIDIYAYGKYKIAIEIDTGHQLKYNSIEKLMESDANIRIGIIGDISHHYLLLNNIYRVKKASDTFNYNQIISFIFVGSKKIIYNSLDALADINLSYFMPTVNLKNNSTMYRTKEKFIRAYNSWSEKEDEQLIREFKENKSISEIVNSHQRNEGAIRSRIKKLRLLK